MDVQRWEWELQLEWVLTKKIQFIMVFFLELYQFLFWFVKTLLRCRSLILDFYLKVIFRRCMFRGDSKHFTLNGYWWKISQFIMVFFLELYQFLFWFFKTFPRWRNISLEFTLKVIFRIWMFIIDGKHFILDGSLWKLSRFIMVFFLEIHQLFFLLFKTLIRWWNLVLEFAFKVIFRIRRFRIDGKHFILDGYWWKRY